MIASGQAVGLALHALSRNRRLARPRPLRRPRPRRRPEPPADPAAEPGRLGRAPLRCSPSSSATSSPSSPSPGGRAPPSTRAGARRSPFLGWAGAAALALAAVVGRLGRPRPSASTAASSTSGRPRRAARRGPGCACPARWARSWRRTCGSRGATRASRRSSSPASSARSSCCSSSGRASAGPLRPGLLLAVASFSGLGALGANAFALERQGLGLLFGVPGGPLPDPRRQEPRRDRAAAARAPRRLGRDPRDRRSRLRARRGDRRAPDPGARGGGGQLPLDPLPGAGGRGGPRPERARLGDARPRRRRSSRSSRCSRRSSSPRPSCSSPGCPQLLGERWLWALTLPARPRRGRGRPLHGHRRPRRACSPRREPELVARMAGED